MSIPPRLDLPPGAQAEILGTARGPRAALLAPTAGARGTALLVPGFTGSKEDFLSLLRPLNDHGWSVASYDQRGQFESAGLAPPTEDPASDLDVLADDLLAVAAALQDAGPVHLVGHSLGGLVAREAVVREPRAWASLTLLCSGPAAIPETHRGALEALRAAIPALTLEQVWVLREEMDRQAGVPTPPPEVQAFLHERFVANDPTWLRAKAGILLYEPDRTDELAAVLARAGLPAAVVAGADDDVWLPPVQRTMAERLGAPFRTVPTAGHSPAVDQPDATAAALVQGWRGAAAE